MKKHALIIGASGEIGGAAAIELSKEYDLTLAGGKNRASLDGLCKAISSAQGKCALQAFSGDVSDPVFAEETVKKALEAAPVDVFVHCAGVSYTGLLQEMAAEDWDKVMSTNLSSCFYFAKALIPGMLRHGGRMVFVSSIWGGTGASCEVAYSASKAGMEGFVRALAKELAPSGIPVNAISPGFIDTKMNGNLSAEEKQAFIETIPSGRAGTPKETAEAIAGLLRMPAYMTGQIVRLDGGLL